MNIFLKSHEIKFSLGIYASYTNLCSLLLMVFFSSFLLNSCSSKSDIESCAGSERNYEKYAIYNTAAVATAHPIATRVGVEVLNNGGNAVDAAIAIQFALAVCYPIAGNIGGGGFMIFRSNEGDVDALDFRERAPMSSHRDMYLDQDGELKNDKSREGHLACGVPGSVDGMWQAFNKYSKQKDWNALLKPAIELARNGFQITDQQAENLNKNRNKFARVNYSPVSFMKKSLWKEGDILIQNDLAKTLESIARHGRDGFYDSWVSDRILHEMKKGSGIITREDLGQYKAVWREPLTTHYRGYRMITMPPPSSGGVALIQLLEMAEYFKLSSMSRYSTRRLHLMAELYKRIFADRSEYLGDPDFYDVPVDDLISEAYLKKRIADFDPLCASSAGEIDAGLFHESDQTTHFSVVDSEGNAVSITTTINTAYGSGVVVEGAGFLLNNEMDDFSAKTGFPNYFGLVGSEANAIQPGKRMLSSMSPTIVEDNESLCLVVGSPGGSKIITTVFQVLIDLIDHNQDLYSAIKACRVHHQWKPDYFYYEEQCLNASLIDSLENLGHQTKSREAYGRVDAIRILSDGRIEAAADPRGDDTVGGY